MSVLITGASGFVGKNLIPYLSNHNIDCKTISKIELYNEFEKKMNGISSIIHLAGKAHDLKKSSNPDEYYQVNFELTKKIYDAFLVSAATKFIFISSVKAAADQISGYLTEDVIAMPLTDYGRSKRMAEEYIEQQPLPAGKSYYILRPCMIHGPGNKGNLNLLYRVVKMRIPYPLAAFMNERSFLSIENLCFVLHELIIQNGIVPGIYNVADDKSLSTNDVVKILSGALSKDERLWRISPSVVKSIARIGDVLHLPLTTERLNKLTENYKVSNDKLKKAINKPLPVSTEEGLKITALSFQST